MNKIEQLLQQLCPASTGKATGGDPVPSVPELVEGTTINNKNNE